MEKPTAKMTAAGQDISEQLINAFIMKSMGGLGGCKEFDEANFSPEYLPYIKAYLDEEILSVDAIYMAMRDAQ